MSRICSVLGLLVLLGGTIAATVVWGAYVQRAINRTSIVMGLDRAGHFLNSVCTIASMSFAADAAQHIQGPCTGVWVSTLVVIAVVTVISIHATRHAKRFVVMGRHPLVRNLSVTRGICATTLSGVLVFALLVVWSGQAISNAALPLGLVVLQQTCNNTNITTDYGVVCALLTDLDLTTTALDACDAAFVDTLCNHDVDTLFTPYYVTWSMACTMVVLLALYLVVVSSDHGKLRQEREDKPELLVCPGEYEPLNGAAVPLLQETHVFGHPPSYAASGSQTKRGLAYA